MRVIVIEDEIPAARELTGLLARLRPDWTVAAILQSIDEGIGWLNDNPQPDLIFADIQLADGLSFQIFSTVAITCPVIFCTAFDQYAIRAFETNGIDYVLKPVEPERLTTALKKYENLTRAAPQPLPTLPFFKQLLEQLRLPSFPTSLLVYHRDAIIPLPVADILFIHYESGVVLATSQSQQRFVLTQTLDELEALLSPQPFFRANRQYIIHRQSIVNAERYFGRKLVVKLTAPVPEPVIISKAKAGEFLTWLQQ
ncbi:LytR/AlgR family response regulator transcription factor [Larkinella punicea]|uniref:DNA-binding response regulator n=1 Tax=Larkinella punicea TaxID=2315727 RepID=A0A368JIU2_9BACT|nr:LytTR family DNA-binding domain-containing protein [Larkinella punicea]RCR67577.1 DNA-binding response regulator [Larkinella punicea]